MSISSIDMISPLRANYVEKYNKKKVSFDFDGVLTRADVQRYAKLLIKIGYEVHILTSRHQEHDLFDGKHQDLYQVSSKLGIYDDNIHFLNCSDKSKFFIENPGFTFHLDDDWFVVDDINEHTDTLSVCVLQGGWVLKCDELLKDMTVMYTDRDSIRKRISQLLNSRVEEDPLEFLNLIKKDIEGLIKQNKK